MIEFVCNGKQGEPAVREMMVRGAQSCYIMFTDDEPLMVIWDSVGRISRMHRCDVRVYSCAEDGITTLDVALCTGTPHIKFGGTTARARLMVTIAMRYLPQCLLILRGDYIDAVVGGSAYPNAVGVCVHARRARMFDVFPAVLPSISLLTCKYYPGVDTGLLAYIRRARRITTCELILSGDRVPKKLVTQLVRIRHRLNVVLVSDRVDIGWDGLDDALLECRFDTFTVYGKGSLRRATRAVLEHREWMRVRTREPAQPTLPAHTGWPSEHRYCHAGKHVCARQAAGAAPVAPQGDADSARTRHPRPCAVAGGQ